MKEIKSTDKDQKTDGVAGLKKKKTNKSKWLKILLILLVVVGLVWGGFWWCNNKTENLEKQKNEQIAQLKKDKLKLKKQNTRNFQAVANQAVSHQVQAPSKISKTLLLPATPQPLKATWQAS